MIRVVIITALSIVFVFVIAVKAGQPAWFDMDHCDFCKCITAEKGLMEYMHTEYHLIEKGAISLTVVDEKFIEAFERARHKMEQVALELIQAEQAPNACGHCMAYGHLMEIGVVPEMVHNSAGYVVIWTSDDPNVIAEIHEMAEYPGLPNEN